MIFSGNDDNLVAFKTENEALMFVCDLENVKSFYCNMGEEEAKTYPQYKKVVNDYPLRTIVNRAGVAVGRV